MWPARGRAPGLKWTGHVTCKLSFSMVRQLSCQAGSSAATPCCQAGSSAATTCCQVGSSAATSCCQAVAAQLPGWQLSCQTWAAQLPSAVTTIACMHLITRQKAPRVDALLPSCDHKDDPARARSRTRSRFAAQCTFTAFPGRWYRKVERVRLRSHVRLAAVRGSSQWRSGGKMPSRAAHCAAESPCAMHINDTLPRAPSSQLTWRWDKCRMPEERQSVPDRQQSGRGPCLQAQLHLSPRRFRSDSVIIAAHEEYCGHGCQRLVRLRTPGPCTYSLQPRAAPHTRSPAAQARRSSPVVAVAASRA